MPELSTVVASTDLNEAAIAAADGATDYFDAGADVSLIEVPFVESEVINEADIPASANFAPINGATFSNGSDGTGRDFIKLNDPVGGFDFVSIGTGFPKNFYGFRVDSDAGNYMGCKQFDAPVEITATGQHIVVGKVQFRHKAQMFELPNIE